MGWNSSVNPVVTYVRFKSKVLYSGKLAAGTN